MPACMCVYTYAYVHEGQRSMLGVIVNQFLPYFLRRGLSFNHTVSAGLSLPSQCSEYGRVRQHLAFFFMGSESQTRVTRLIQQVFYKLSLLLKHEKSGLRFSTFAVKIPGPPASSQTMSHALGARMWAFQGSVVYGQSLGRAVATQHSGTWTRRLCPQKPCLLHLGPGSFLPVTRKPTRVRAGRGIRAGPPGG